MFDVIKLALETDSSRLDLAVHRHDGRSTTSRTTATGPRCSPSCVRRRRGSSTRWPASSTSLQRDEGGGRRRCSTARWCSTAPAWAAPTRTRTSTCRCCSPAAASSTASTCLRHGEQLPAHQPVRLDAAAPGHRGERVLDRPRATCAGWRWRKHQIGESRPVPTESHGTTPHLWALLPRPE